MGSRVVGGLKALAAVGVVGALILLGVGTLQHRDTSPPPGGPGTEVEVTGIPIRYVQSGHGPDVLLIHGSPGSLEDWSPIIARMADRFRVTAFDRPGQGYSGGGDLPHTPEENARVTLELIRALRLRNVVVVGHSYGGTTGLALATQNPEEVRAFVIVGSRAYGPVSVGPLFRLLAVPTLGAGFAAVAGAWIGPRQIETGIRAAFGPNADLIPPGFVAQRTKIWNRPGVTTTLSKERMTLGAALEKMAGRYREIRKPVFLVCGEQDERNFRDATRLVHEIPGATLTSLPNTGHYVQFARPDALIRVIDQAAAAP